MEIILHDGIDSDAVAAPAATNVPAHVKSEWAQCERCNKWRRLPRTVAAASLKGTWFCELLPSTDEHNSCDAPEERLKYGAWEQEDLRLLQPEVDGTKLILNDQSATGYKGVALQNNESNDLPYRVEYASDERGNIIAKSQGVRKTMYFATDVEAALWYARNVHPGVEAGRRAREQAAERRAADREQRERERVADRELSRLRKIQAKAAAKAIAVAARAAVAAAKPAAARPTATKPRATKPVATKPAHRPTTVKPTATKPAAASGAGAAKPTSSNSSAAAAPAPAFAPAPAPAPAPAAPLRRPPPGTASSVRGALARIGLEQYAAALEELGYDDLGYLGMLSEERLRQVAAEASMKPGHVGKFAAWLMTGPPAASQWL